MNVQNYLTRTLAPFHPIASLFSRNPHPLNRITEVFNNNHSQIETSLSKVTPENFIQQPFIKLILKDLSRSIDRGDEFILLIRRLRREASTQKISSWQLLMAIYHHSKTTYFHLTEQVLMTNHSEYIELVLSTFKDDKGSCLKDEDVQEFIFSGRKQQEVHLRKSSILVNQTILQHLFPHYQIQDTPLKVSRKCFINFLTHLLRKPTFEVKKNNYKRLLVIAEYFQLEPLKKTCEQWLIENHQRFSHQKLFSLATHFNLPSINKLDSLIEVIACVYFKNAPLQELYAIFSFKDLLSYELLAITSERQAEEAFQNYLNLKEQVLSKGLNWKLFLRHCHLLNQQAVAPLLDYTLTIGATSCAKELLFALNLDELEAFFNDYGDLKVIIEQQEIPVRKDILAMIPYFQAMFEHNTIETTSQVISLESFKLSYFKAILSRYFLEEPLNFKIDTIEEFFSFALYLQLEPLIKDCESWLIQNIQEIDIPSLFKLAKKCNLIELKKRLLQDYPRDICVFFDQHTAIVDKLLQTNDLGEKIEIYDHIKQLADTESQPISWPSCLEYLNHFYPKIILNLFNYFLANGHKAQVASLFSILKEEQLLQLMELLIYTEDNQEKIHFIDGLKLLIEIESKPACWESFLNHLYQNDPKTILELFNYLLINGQKEQITFFLSIISKEHLLQSIQELGNLRIRFKHGPVQRFHTLIFSIFFPSIIFEKRFVQLDIEADDFERVINRKISKLPLVSALTDILAVYKALESLKIDQYNEELVDFFNSHTSNIGNLNNEDINDLVDMYVEAKKCHRLKSWFYLIEETLLNIATYYQEKHTFPLILSTDEIAYNQDKLCQWLISKKTLTGTLVEKWLLYPDLLPNVNHLNFLKPSYEEIHVAKNAIENGLKVEIHITSSDTNVIYWCHSIPLKSLHFAHLTTFTNFDILQLGKLTTLKTLSFAHTAVTTDQLKRMPKNPIQMLDLSGCFKLSAIAFCHKAFPHLKHLKLAQLPIFSNELKKLSKLKLTSLDLSSCIIRKSDLLEIAHLKTLEVLNLSDLSINDAILIMLSKLQLRQLIIKECVDYSEEALSVLKKQSNLKIIR